MNITLPRLYQKEIRQITPVIATVLIIGGLLFLVRVAYSLGAHSTATVEWICNLSLFLMPCMYAVGAAAILISQEKEQRTMQWMQTMPIDASKIVLVKAAVSFVGFVAVCLLSQLLVLPWLSEIKPSMRGGMLVGQDALQSVGYYGLAVYLWIAASAASWRTSTLVRSIVLLLMLVILPKLLETLFYSVSDRIYPFDRHSPQDENNLFAFAFVMPTGLLILALGYRWGVASLQPNYSLPNQKIARTIADWKPLAGVQWISRQRLLHPSSAMIWQTIRQFGWPVFLSSLAMIPVLQSYFWDSHSLPLHIAISCGWLGFLGAWAYQSDASHRRMRFLSDRGVSGGRIWLYRVGMMTLIVILTVVLGCYAGYREHLVGERSPLIVVSFALMIFAISQWSGQLAYSMVLALVQTPAVILFALGYMFFSVHELQAPIWILVGMFLLPLVVTRLTMQNWVDGTWNLRFWLTHGIGIVCWLLLPLSTLLYYSVSLPRMKSSVKSAILEEAEIWTDHKSRHVGLATFSGELESGYPNPGITVAKWPEKLEPLVIRNIEDLKSKIDGIKRSGHPMAVDSRTISRIHTLATMTSYFAQNSLGEGTGSPEDWKTLFRESINIFAQLIPHVRNGGQLIQQDNADVMEILLLRHLKSPGNLAMLDRGHLDACKNIFEDREIRVIARKRAVAASWKACLASKQSADGYVDIGGYSLGPFNEKYSLPSWPDQMVNASRVELIVECLWKIASKEGSSDQEIVELASLCNLSKSSALPPARAMDLDQYLIQYPESSSLPAAQWNAKWEDVAQKFAQEDLTNE